MNFKHHTLAKCILFKAATYGIRDYSRLPDAFVERALRVCILCDSEAEIFSSALEYCSDLKKVEVF